MTTGFSLYGNSRHHLVYEDDEREKEDAIGDERPLLTDAACPVDERNDEDITSQD